MGKMLKDVSREDNTGNFSPFTDEELNHLSSPDAYTDDFDRLYGAGSPFSEENGASLEDDIDFFDSLFTYQEDEVAALGENANASSSKQGKARKSEKSKKAKKRKPDAKANLPATLPGTTLFNEHGWSLDLRTKLLNKYWRNDRKNLQCFPYCPEFGDYYNLRVNGQSHSQSGTCKSLVEASLRCPKDIDCTLIVAIMNVCVIDATTGLPESEVGDIEPRSIVVPGRMDLIRKNGFVGHLYGDRGKFKIHFLADRWKVNMELDRKRRPANNKSKVPKYCIENAIFVKVGDVYQFVHRSTSNTFEIASTRTLLRDIQKANGVQPERRKETKSTKSRKSKKAEPKSSSDKYSNGDTTQKRAKRNKVVEQTNFVVVPVPNESYAAGAETVFEELQVKKEDGSKSAAMARRVDERVKREQEEADLQDIVLQIEEDSIPSQSTIRSDSNDIESLSERSVVHSHATTAPASEPVTQMGVPANARRSNERLQKCTYSETRMYWLPPAGIFGSHWFYLKRPKWGFIYMFTFGLLGVGWVTDFLRLGSITRRSNDHGFDDPSVWDLRILWLVLGVFGAHRFEIGHYWMGIYMLCTFGGLGLGYLIDGTRISSMRRKAIAKRNDTNDPMRAPDKIEYWDAMVLLIPGGFLGLHRFYAGKFGSGLLFLCTFGLLGLGVVNDLLNMGSLVDQCNRELVEQFEHDTLMDRRNRTVREQQQVPLTDPSQNSSIPFAEVVR